MSADGDSGRRLEMKLAHLIGQVFLAFNAQFSNPEAGRRGLEAQKFGSALWPLDDTSSLPEYVDDVLSLECLQGKRRWFPIGTVLPQR